MTIPPEKYHQDISHPGQIYSLVGEVVPVAIVMLEIAEVTLTLSRVGITLVGFFKGEGGGGG